MKTHWHENTIGEKMIAPFIRVDEQGSLINTETEGHCKISSYTTVANSKIAKYFAIGLHSFMQRSTTDRYVTIGSRVSIGAFSHPTNWLSTLEFQFRDSQAFYGESLPSTAIRSIEKHVKQTTIGPDVWIGDNCFIKSGIIIGAGAIVGAGSIVTRDVPAYAIIAGNPARKIKSRFDEVTVKELMEIRWWELDIPQLEGIHFDDILRAIEQIKALKKLQGGASQQITGKENTILGS
jgi:virginiamycin A acetyltransferase